LLKPLPVDIVQIEADFSILLLAIPFLYSEYLTLLEAKPGEGFNL